MENVNIHHSSLKTSAAFIEALKGADLDGSAMPKLHIEHLRNPMKVEVEDFRDDEGFLFSLNTFLGTRTASDATYKNLIKCYQGLQPWLDLWSLYRIENCVKDLAGTSTIVHDMCPNTC